MLEVKNISKTIKVNNIRDYYKNHFLTINTLLTKKVTDKEIDVLSYILSLPEEVLALDMFSTPIRKMIQKEFNISNAGVTNILHSLLLKKTVIRNNLGRYSLNPFVYNFKFNNTYTIKIEYEGLEQ